MIQFIIRLGTDLHIMTTNTIPLAEIAHKAIQILCREIGIVNSVRFLNQYSVGQGNYLEDREVIFENQTTEQLVAEIKRGR